MALKDFKIEDVQLFPEFTYCIATRMHGKI